MHAVGMEFSSNPEICVSVDLSCWGFDIWDCWKYRFRVGTDVSSKGTLHLDRMSEYR